MKRGTFKRKTPPEGTFSTFKAKPPLKRRIKGNKRPPRPKKPKKKSISSLKKKLWVQFSIFIRNRDKWTCFTCDRKGEGSGMHAGHFVPKSVGGIALYFHEKNVRCQCYNCNINLGGNQWEYGQRLGKETVDELMLIKRETNKWTQQDYEEKIAYYTGLNNKSVLE